MPKRTNELAKITRANLRSIQEIESRETEKDSLIAFHNGINYMRALSPIGLWPLNQESYTGQHSALVKDLSGNNFHLRPTGITPTKSNSIWVADFNGSTSFMACGSHIFYRQTGDLTFCGWAKRDTDGSGMLLGGPYTDSNTAVGRSWGLYIDSTDFLNFHECPGDSNIDTYSPSFGFNTGIWTFFAAVRSDSADTVSFFQNDNYESVDRNGGDSALFDTFFTLGARMKRDGTLDGLFDGKLSAVAVFHQALSQDVLNTIYNIMKPVYLYG